MVGGTSEIDQRRGMKTMSSVKKRCEGCKVRLCLFRVFWKLFHLRLRLDLGFTSLEKEEEGTVGWI